MAKKGYRKCTSCEEFFDFEPGGYIACAGNEYDGKAVCSSCYEDDHAEPVARLAYSAPGLDESGAGSIGLYSVWAPGFEELAEEYAATVKWAGAGWRGSYQGKAPAGFVSVLDSWFGTVDGHLHGDEVLGRFQEKWDAGGERPNFALLVAFPRTSNVCSCGIEVYAPKDKREEFAAWLGL